ncbi:MAG: hypothetical protein O4807_08155 [Trichodesmium sp. St19_bin2]|nr:hypothetical protein [Trichodesmium sp. St19_bin2]
MNKVLADFAEHFGFGKHKGVTLVCDRLRWYISLQVEVPNGIDLVFILPLSLLLCNQKNVCCL